MSLFADLGRAQTLEVNELSGAFGLRSGLESSGTGEASVACDPEGGRCLLVHTERSAGRTSPPGPLYVDVLLFGPDGAVTRPLLSPTELGVMPRGVFFRPRVAFAGSRFALVVVQSVPGDTERSFLRTFTVAPGRDGRMVELAAGIAERPVTANAIAAIACEHSGVSCAVAAGPVPSAAGATSTVLLDTMLPTMAPNLLGAETPVARPMLQQDPSLAVFAGNYQLAYTHQEMMAPSVVRGIGFRVNSLGRLVLGIGSEVTYGAPGADPSGNLGFALFEGRGYHYAKVAPGTTLGSPVTVTPVRDLVPEPGRSAVSFAPPRPMEVFLAAASNAAGTLTLSQQSGSPSSSVALQDPSGGTTAGVAFTPRPPMYGVTSSELTALGSRRWILVQHTDRFPSVRVFVITHRCTSDAHCPAGALCLNATGECRTPSDAGLPDAPPDAPLDQPTDRPGDRPQDTPRDAPPDHPPPSDLGVVDALDDALDDTLDDAQDAPAAPLSPPTLHLRGGGGCGCGALPAAGSRALGVALLVVLGRRRRWGILRGHAHATHLCRAR